MWRSIISSRQNPRIRRLVRLLSGKSRREPFFLVEGESLVRELLAAGWEVDSIFQAGGRPLSGSIPCFQVSPSILRSLSSLEHPPGVLAAVRKRLSGLDAVHLRRGALLLDGLGDPGNVGTLLRSAAAFGADAVLATPGTVHLYHPKVVRAAMGAVLRMDLAEEIQPQDLEILLRRTGAALVVADNHTGQPPEALGRTGPVVLALGHETTGVSPPLERLASLRVRIPMMPEVESLNVGVAGSILLYQMALGRREPVPVAGRLGPRGELAASSLPPGRQ